MLKQLKSLNSFSDDAFLAQAYSDYMKTVNDNYANLMTALTEASTYEFAEGETIEEAIDAICANYGINRVCNICLNNGYSTFEEVCRVALTQIEKYSDIEDEESPDALSDKVLTLRSNVGDLMPDVKVSVSEIFNNIKSNFHSSTVLEAAFNSVSGETVADRMNTFKDKIQSKFTNVFDDISATFNVMSDMIGSQFTNVSTFIGQVVSFMGIDKQASDDNFTVNDADMTQFTGASPVPALDFTTAANAVVSTGKVVGVAVAGLFKGIANIAGKVFSWAAKKIEHVVIPYDLEVIDENAPGYTVDGWGFTMKNRQIATDDMSSTFGHIVIDDPDLWRSVIANQFDNWIKLNFIGMEFLVKITDAEVVSGKNQLLLHIDCKAKPKPINPDVVASTFASKGWNVTYQKGASMANYIRLGSRTFASSAEADETLADTIDLIKNANYLPDVGNDNEVDSYNAFMCGIGLTKYVLACARDILIDVEDTSITLNPGVDIVLRETDFAPTNADWIAILSGWDMNTANPHFGLSIPTYGGGSASVASIFDDMAVLLALQQWDKYYYPLDYIFLPYRNNIADFDNSKFGIKTDSANQSALTNFLTNVVIVTVVAIVAIYTGVKIRSLRRNKLMKRVAAVGRLDNKMWNGGVLTNKEKRQYIRYNRKINASSILTGGIQESASDAASGIFSAVTTNSENADVLRLSELENIISGY